MGNTLILWGNEPCCNIAMTASSLRFKNQIDPLSHSDRVYEHHRQRTGHNSV